jgi:hypothetical protein
MKKVAMFLAAGATFAVPQAAGAACAEFRTSAADLSLTYDPFGHAVLDRVFTLRVRRLDPAATSVRLLLVDPDSVGGAPRLGSAGPGDYDISWNSDTGRRVLVTGAEQPNATNGALVRFGPGPSGDVVNETFRIRVPAGQSVAAGDYYQPLDVRHICYAGDDALDSPDVQTGAQVAIDLEVPEQIATFIGSVGIRRGQIDFGALDVAGGPQTRGLVVTAQATVPYEVDVHSARGGLKRGASDPYTLAYRMRLSGFLVADGDRIACGRSEAPTGRSHPLQVEIDPRQAMAAPAGSYSDVVTLTFSPRLGLSAGDGCAPTGA